MKIRREGLQNHRSDQLSDITDSDHAFHETNPPVDEEEDASSSSIDEDIYSTGEDGDSIKKDSSHEQNTNKEVAIGVTPTPSLGYDLSGRNFAPQEEEKTEVEDYRNEGNGSTPSYLDNGRVAPVNQSSSQSHQVEGEIIHSEKGSSLHEVEEGDQGSATSSPDVGAGDKKKEKSRLKLYLQVCGIISIIGVVMFVVLVLIAIKSDKIAYHN